MIPSGVYLFPTWTILPFQLIKSLQHVISGFFLFILALPFCLPPPPRTFLLRPGQCFPCLAHSEFWTFLYCFFLAWNTFLSRLHFSNPEMAFRTLASSASVTWPSWSSQPILTSFLSLKPYKCVLFLPLVHVCFPVVWYMLEKREQSMLFPLTSVPILDTYVRVHID